MVVSEIGDTWSPPTAPANTAATVIVAKFISVPVTARTIGIKIPKVPHEVPVANASPNATKKNTVGKRMDTV